MTRKVFWDDPYRARLDTKITNVSGDEITLEATIFYALSGGQESDAGCIAGRPVTLARWDDREIVYRLADTAGLRPGDPVRVEIDWPRRYRLMRLHFAAEIVLELICRRLPGADKIGAHIAADKARAGERRYWKIREFARVPCGGTHLRRTGEVGALALKRKNIGKGKERIEITLADVTGH